LLLSSVQQAVVLADLLPVVKCYVMHLFGSKDPCVLFW